MVEPADSHLCCGSAGTYNLMQPEISAQLKDRKIKTLADQRNPELADLYAEVAHSVLVGWNGGEARELCETALLVNPSQTDARAILARLAEGSGAPYRDFLARAEEESGAALDVTLADVAAHPLVVAGVTKVRRDVHRSRPIKFK